MTQEQSEAGSDLPEWGWRVRKWGQDYITASGLAAAANDDNTTIVWWVNE